MAIGDGVPIGAVKTRVVGRDLSEVSVSRTSERVRKDKVKEDSCGVGEPSASRTEEGARDTGKGLVARTSRRSKAVGAGSVGSRGFRVLSVRSAEENVESISSGRRGLGPPRKPMAFCASLERRVSLRGSPPVPARVCSLSPVKIWRQERGRLAARAVKPACPPC